MMDWLKPFVLSRRGWAAIAAVAVLVGLGWWFFVPASPPVDQNANKGRAPTQSAKIEVELSQNQLNAVKIGQMARANFEQLRPAVGNIDFNQNMLVQVFTPNPGRIIQAFANVGDRVLRGQVLFTIDSPDLLTAESNLIQAAGVLVLQNANLKRLRETLRGGGGAQKDVDQATSDQQTAEGNLRTARDNVRIFGKTDEEVDQIIALRKADSVLVVRSPIAGIVTQRTAAPGLYVQPGNAPAPFTVADTSTMWMLANVVEAEAPELRIGQAVKVKVSAWPGREFDGAITVLGAQVDPATRRLLVRSEIRDPDRLLRAGMFATFTIKVGDTVNSTAVPSAAVVREGDGTMSVWVTTDRRHFQKRTVKTGLQQNGQTQILEGVQPGETVVTDGAVFLSNKLIAAPTE
jgi:cobalt-zinc-cadmium efflux system membrane fusion protein